MYSDNGKPGLMTAALTFLSIVILFCLIVVYRLHVPEDMEEETAVSIRNAVRESALQCYVVEGVYPENIEYLQENYGLRINTKAYIVAYEAFAENQMPQIKVVKRKQ